MIHRPLADPGTLLLRALDESLHAAGCVATVDHRGARAWASITFEGSQHRLTVAAQPGAAIEGWLAALPEAELPMRRHVALEPAIDRVERRADAVVAELCVLVLQDA